MKLNLKRLKRYNHLAAVFVVLFGTMILAESAHAQTADPHSHKIARRFAAHRKEALKAFADFLNVTPPASCMDLIDKLIAPKTDPLKLQAPYQAIMLAPQAKTDPRLSALRHIVQEALGAATTARLWPSQLLERFIRDLIRQLPENCLYLCSSDEGRFAVLAYLHALDRTDVAVVSYNRLSDPSYISYLRWKHKGSITLPDKTTVSRTIKTYLEALNCGQSPFSGGAIIKEGRVRLEGPESQLAINSELTRHVFEQNKETRSIFVEVDSPLPWVYADATPRGLLLTLSPTSPPPTTLDARRSERFWEPRMPEKVLKKAVFPARRLSRLRLAQARAFAEAGLSVGAEKAFEQSINAFPGPDAIVDLVETLYLPDDRFRDARALLDSETNRVKAYKHILSSEDKRAFAQFKALPQRVEEQQSIEKRIRSLRAREPSDAETITLARLLLKRGKQRKAAKVTRAIPLDPLPEDPEVLQHLLELQYATEQEELARSLLARLARDAPEEQNPQRAVAAASVAAQNHQNGPAIILLGRYLQLTPEDWRARLDLATLYSLTMRKEQARKTITRAVKDGGNAALETCRRNKRLNSLLPEKREEKQPDLNGLQR